MIRVSVPEGWALVTQASAAVSRHRWKTQEGTPRRLFQCPVTLLNCVGRGALGRPTDVMPAQ